MRVRPITKPRSLPVQADNLLEKALAISNFLDLVAVAQEVSDLLMKTDTFDNN